MKATTVAQFEAVVAMALLAACVALIAVRLTKARLIDGLRRGFLAAAGLIAVAATAGSLWFSEVANFPPCKLCWFQRIAMYPLAVIIPIAAVRRDLSVRIYALAIAGAGLAVNVWHLYVETFPERSHGGCDPSNPCTIRWVEAFGFWTIPRMACVAFVAIITLLTLSKQRGPADA